MGTEGVYCVTTLLPLHVTRCYLLFLVEKTVKFVAVIARDT